MSRRIHAHFVLPVLIVSLAGGLCGNTARADAPWSTEIAPAFQRAGDNRSQIQDALDKYLAMAVAKRDKQAIDIVAADVEGLVVRLNDDMLDLDRNVVVSVKQEPYYSGCLQRTIGTLAETMKRGDPRLVFSARIAIALSRK